MELLDAMRRFYKAHIIGCVGELAADITVTVRVMADRVLCSTAEHAKGLGDADLGLKAEGLRREAALTALQHDSSSTTSACIEQVRTSLLSHPMHGMGGSAS